jgi:hypothetical protein
VLPSSHFIATPTTYHPCSLWLKTFVTATPWVQSLLTPSQCCNQLCPMLKSTTRSERETNMPWLAAWIRTHAYNSKQRTRTFLSSVMQLRAFWQKSSNFLERSTASIFSTEVLGTSVLRKVGKFLPEYRGSYPNVKVGTSNSQS